MNTSCAAADSALSPLVECLEEEYRALLAEDATRLETVLREKERLLKRLSNLPAVAGAPRTGAAHNAPWKQAIERVRALTRRNEKLLAPRLLRYSARLRFLQYILAREAVYGADGAIRRGRVHTTLAQRA